MYGQDPQTEPKFTPEELPDSGDLADEAYDLWRDYNVNITDCLSINPAGEPCH